MWDLMYPGACRSNQQQQQYRNSRHHHHHDHCNHDHHHPHHLHHHHHNDRTSSNTNRCRVCRAEIGTARVHGQRVHLFYCQQHYCAWILPGGLICSAQNNGKTRYCDNHSRCTATSEHNQGRCWNTVKEEDPERFKYCKDHSCPFPTCATRRTDPSNPHCALHRCTKATCDKPRLLSLVSLFCERHTCEAGGCTAQVDGRSEKGDASRFCDNHRLCAVTGCMRRCHIRTVMSIIADVIKNSNSNNNNNNNPVVARYCGVHHCRAEENSNATDGGGGGVCEELRLGEAGAKYCARHTCIEAGCVRGKKDMSGNSSARFCDSHACKSEGCGERRDPRIIISSGGMVGGAAAAEYCPVHRCVVEGCVRAALPASTVGYGNGNGQTNGASRCENHQVCCASGCREWVFVERGPGGEKRYRECERHHLPRCQAQLLPNTRCPNRVPYHRDFFTSSSTSSLNDNNNNNNNTDPSHTNNTNPMTNPPIPRYCNDHACAVRACPHPRPSDSLQYCSLHKCDAPLCQEQVKNAVWISLLPQSLGLGMDSNAAAVQARLVLAAAAAAANQANTNLDNSNGVGVRGVGGLSAAAAAFLLSSGNATGLDANTINLNHLLPNRFCISHTCQGDSGRCTAGINLTNTLPQPLTTTTTSSTSRRPPHRFCDRHECIRRGCLAEATRFVYASSRSRSRRRPGQWRSGRRFNGNSCRDTTNDNIPNGLCERHYKSRREQRDDEDGPSCPLTGGGGGGGGGGGMFPPPMGMPMPVPFPPSVPPPPPCFGMPSPGLGNGVFYHPHSHHNHHHDHPHHQHHRHHHHHTYPHQNNGGDSTSSSSGGGGSGNGSSSGSESGHDNEATDNSGNARNRQRRPACGGHCGGPFC